MMEFITANYEVILLVLAGIVALILMGKRKSLELAKSIILELRDTVGDDIKANKDKYAEYIYARLPIKAKLFIGKKMIVKIIEELGDFVDID